MNILEHTYQNIFGWFDYDDIYKEQVDNAADGDKFVEIGSLFGKSACFMGVEIKNSNKNITLDCIDYWDERGVPELNIPNNPEYDYYKCGYNYVEHGKDIIFQVFNKNIERAGIKDIVIAKRMSSQEAFKLYRDESLDFIFVDGDHSYQGVHNDIKNWLPKLKFGKTMAGHDYDWAVVRKAVVDFFGIENIKASRSSWIYTKK